jgi:nicotinamide mononucleotide transporter
VEAWARIVESAAQTAPLEWLGVVLALGYLLLAVRQHVACWAFAIASSMVYLFVFARAALYMQAALQLFYVAMALYGWWAWRGGGSGAMLPVTRWPARRHFALLAVALALAIATGAWLDSSTAAVAAYADALITWGSVATTWLVARKVLENWLYWIVLDLGAAALYWSQGLAATAVLFLLYTGIAAHGYRRWRADLSDAARIRGGSGNAVE